jgi:acetoin utilization deacetylase AcuC-like enzyme
MKRVAMFTHRDCLHHDPGPFHPESPARLRAVLAALEHPDFVPLLREQAPLATREQLCLAHPAAYVDAILALAPEAGDCLALDSDTFVSAGTVAAARRGAGAAIAGVDAVMEGWADSAFAATRPPGHHAEPARAMGFCLFVNASIAALHARRRWSLKRIAVVDFDVHHGNGTQDIFYNDPDLFYTSSHQMPCYPGTGAPGEHGVANNVLNLPLAPGSGSTQFREVWTHVGLPAVEEFKPELLLISAGFDAHRADPLAHLTLDTEDFGWITDRLISVAEGACDGRIVSVLEGGYDLPALAASVALHVRRLLGI